MSLDCLHISSYPQILVSHLCFPSSLTVKREESDDRERNREKQRQNILTKTIQSTCAKKRKNSLVLRDAVPKLLKQAGGTLSSTRPSPPPAKQLRSAAAGRERRAQRLLGRAFLVESMCTNCARTSRTAAGDRGVERQPPLERASILRSPAAPGNGRRWHGKCQLPLAILEVVCLGRGSKSRLAALQINVAFSCSEH